MVNARPEDVHDRGASALIPDQRREMLMRLLRREGVLSVVQLTQLLGVSHMTVRRDIAALERDGRAYSVPGGVRHANSLHEEPTFATKAMSERGEKVAIASAAEALLDDGMTIYLDAGTTTGALVPALRGRRRMTVITNDFVITNQLTGSDVEVINTGGRLDHTNRSAVGRLAAEALRRLNTDIAFISASSWDLAHGITTPSEAKVDVKIAAVERASAAVLLATSSKYGSFGMYDVMPLRRLDRIITDAGLAPAVASGIHDLGIDLDLAPVPDAGQHRQDSTG